VSEEESERAEPTRVAPDDRPPQRFFAPGLLLILVAATLTYLPSLDHAFQFDDAWKIVENRSIRDPAIYLSGFASGQYSDGISRLLPNLSLALNYALFGLDPRGYHATNLIFHLLNVVLLAGFGRAAMGQLGIAGATPVALLSAAIFALHPLNSEAVLYCNARPNVMATGFYLAGLWAVLGAEARRAAGRSARAAWAGFGASLLLALFCKELAVTLVLMAPLMVLWFRRETAARWLAQPAIRWLLGLGGLAALAAGLASGALFEVQRALLDVGEHVAGSPLVYLGLTLFEQSEIFVRYLALALLPWPGLLNVDRTPLGRLHERVYEAGRVVDGAWVELLLPLFCGAVLLLSLRAIVTRRHRAPFLCFMALWPVITHAPTSLVPRGQVMVEYRTYLPMVGLCLLLGFGLYRLGAGLLASVAGPRRVALPAIVALLGLLSAATVVRARDWQTPTSLWQASLRHLPRNPRALNSLGMEAREAGDMPAAIAYFRRAVEADPDYGPGQNNLGSLLAMTGDWQGAARHLAITARLEPDRPGTHNNLGNVLARLGRFEEAFEQYRRAIAADPLFADAEANYGLALSQSGDGAAAVAHYRRALELQPGRVPVRVWLARALVAGGQVRQGIGELERALAGDPTHAPAHFELGKALAAHGDYGGARGHLARAAELAPGTRIGNEAHAYLQALQ